jgi:hypothetical protein
MAQQHQAQTTVDHFLVNRHVFEKIGFGHLLGRDHRQTGALEQANTAITLLFADPAQARGHLQAITVPAATASPCNQTP